MGPGIPILGLASLPSCPIPVSQTVRDFRKIQHKEQVPITNVLDTLGLPTHKKTDAAADCIVGL